jgi:hypothetical protein
MQVWSDLADDQLQSIPGVTRIEESTIGGRYVYIDKRYSLADIQAEILKHAEQ